MDRGRMSASAVQMGIGLDREGGHAAGSGPLRTAAIRRDGQRVGRAAPGDAYPLRMGCGGSAQHDRMISATFTPAGAIGFVRACRRTHRAVPDAAGAHLAALPVIRPPALARTGCAPARHTDAPTVASPERGPFRAHVDSSTPTIPNTALRQRGPVFRTGRDR